MPNWEEPAITGQPLEWPYKVSYGKEREVYTDVLVLGGGLAGFHTAVAAAKRGLRVAVVEKGGPINSGAAGAGNDHWLYTANPCSKITPEEIVEAEASGTGGYTNAISRYIASREGYDTLLEQEEMGAKIRDEDDEFVGAAFRDEKTKFLFAYDYENKLHFRNWGITTKPALYKECKRLGVGIHDRTQATALLTEGGKQGGKVVGATTVNIRTGAFTIFKAKATVMCLSRPQRIWQFSSEVVGLATLRPHTCIGNGHAMAWRAGAALTLMEKSQRRSYTEVGYAYHHGTGNCSNTWYACTIVDADGKEIPWVDRDGNILKDYYDRYRPAPGQKFMGERTMAYEYRLKKLLPDLIERIRNGEYKLPLYCDLPSMPELERKAVWGLMVGEEGKTKIPILEKYNQSGFNSGRDLLQNYVLMGGRETLGLGIQGLPQQRTFGEGGDAGGLLIDWDLKTTLDGLYAAGDGLFAGNYHHHAAATGRYAGRKAATYAAKAADSVISRAQVDAEKARVYAPVKRKEGIEWKELNQALCRVMQNYCGDPKHENLLNVGLVWLKDLEGNEASQAYASDPHKLGRIIDVLDLITNSQIITHACLARKSSSKYLDFNRLDYPEMDPPEWHKWVTLRQEKGEVKVDTLPIDFWGPLTENYEVHNKDYQGWYKKSRRRR